MLVFFKDFFDFCDFFKIFEILFEICGILNKSALPCKGWRTPCIDCTGMCADCMGGFFFPVKFCTIGYILESLHIELIRNRHKMVKNVQQCHSFDRIPQ